MDETKLINGYPFILHHQQKVSEEQSLNNSQQFLNTMLKRRSVRDFSSEPISKEVIETILAAANTAPSGANKQPWPFAWCRMLL